MKASTICTTTILFLATGMSTAHAVDVCGTIKFWDDRSITSNRDGSFLPTLGSNKNAYAYAVTIQVMDMDGSCIDDAAGCSETDDDELGEVTTSEEDGSYCVTGLELNEDIYLRTEYTGADFIISPDSDTAISVSTARYDDVTSNLTFNWNITCVDDARNATNGECDSQSDVDTYFSDERDWSVLAASVVRVFSAYTSSARLNGHDNQVTVYYPSGPSSQCSGKAGSSWGYDSICVSSGFVLNNHVVAHEVGHLIHRRAINDSSSLSNGSCTSGDNWDSHSTVDGQKCATSEGWAHFVAVSSHFSDDSDGTGGGYPYYRETTKVVEGDTTRGNSGSSESCVSDSDNPHTARGNVARWYWDLFDSTNETSSDNANYTLSLLTSTWDEFPAGTGDADAAETGDDGRNAWDYECYEALAHSELTLNCLGSQDTSTCPN